MPLYDTFDQAYQTLQDVNNQAFIARETLLQQCNQSLQVTPNLTGNFRGLQVLVRDSQQARIAAMQDTVNQLAERLQGLSCVVKYWQPSVDNESVMLSAHY